MESLNNKKAIFLDKVGNVQTAIISSVIEKFINIKVYNQEEVETGYMNFYFHPNKRIYLDTIYCYDKFRGCGIAKGMSELADYLLQEYNNYIIRGVYSPSQLSTDRENNIMRSNIDLDIRARHFYKSCGYQIVSYQEYLMCPNNYPEITIRDDFQLGEEIVDKIIVKKVVLRPTYLFTEIDNILVANNILELTDDDTRIKIKKLL